MYPGNFNWAFGRPNDWAYLSLAFDQNQAQYLQHEKAQSSGTVKVRVRKISHHPAALRIDDTSDQVGV